jgi:two-component system, OmpR family, sensor histidine kinase BaeS
MMSIQKKVFLAILLSSIALVLVMMQLLQWSLDKGLVEYANERQNRQYQPLARELESHFADRGSWRFMQENRRLFDDLIAEYSNEPRQERREMRPPPGGRRDRPGRGNRPPEQRPPPKPITLLNTNGRMIVGSRQDLEKAYRIKLEVEGELVGFLAFPDNQKLGTDFELQLVERQEEGLLLAGFVVIFLAGISAFLFAPTIVRPIKNIADGTRELILGNYSIELDIKRQDEIGELAKDINQLGETLTANEELRQRWLADTSHELRTPLAVIKAETEAMLDGVREITRENLLSIFQEINHLHKLIDDVADLSNLDLGNLRYNKEILDLRELLISKRNRIQRSCEEYKLTFVCDPGKSELLVWADEVRMSQMLDNLITNSCKYTDSPGKITIRLSSHSGNAELIVEDSFPGVPEDALPKLFEHLYRVESSRNRRTGGSGLGLAIASKIVDGHEGQIMAEHADAGGLKITVTLPIMEDADD